MAPNVRRKYLKFLTHSLLRMILSHKTAPKTSQTETFTLINIFEKFHLDDDGIWAQSDTEDATEIV